MNRRGLQDKGGKKKIGEERKVERWGRGVIEEERGMMEKEGEEDREEELERNRS